MYGVLLITVIITIIIIIICSIRDTDLLQVLTRQQRRGDEDIIDQLYKRINEDEGYDAICPCRLLLGIHNASAMDSWA